MILKTPPLILLLILLSPAWAGAGYISLQNYATSTIFEAGVRVKISTTNVGDEPAYEVQHHVFFQGLRKSSAILPKLNPGDNHTVSLELMPDLALPGSYSIQVLIDFHDSNGRLFSALSHASFVFEEPVNLDVFIEPQDIEMSDSATLDLEVINRDTKPKEVTVNLALPRELKARPTRHVFKIKGQGARKIKFSLTNFSALQGATYPVLAFLEYTENGRHHSLVSESMVSVVNAANFFRENQTGLIIAACVLIVLIALFEIFRLRKNKNEAAA